MGSLNKKPIKKLLKFYYQLFRTMDEETKVVSIGAILNKINTNNYNYKKLCELSEQLEYIHYSNKIKLPKGTTDLETAQFLNKIKYYLNREGIEIKSLTIAITI